MSRYNVIPRNAVQNIINTDYNVIRCIEIVTKYVLKHLFLKKFSIIHLRYHFKAYQIKHRMEFFFSEILYLLSIHFNDHHILFTSLKLIPKEL